MMDSPWIACPRKHISFLANKDEPKTTADPEASPEIPDTSSRKRICSVAARSCNKPKINGERCFFLYVERCFNS